MPLTNAQLELQIKALRLELRSKTISEAVQNAVIAALEYHVDAQAYLTAAATTTVATMGVFVPVVGTFTIATGAENISLNVDNEFVYTGARNIRALFTAAFTVDPASNDKLAFRASKNGVTQDYSETIIEQGFGVGASPRVGAVVALLDLATNDEVGLYLTDLTGAGTVDWLTCTYLIVRV